MTILEISVIPIGTNSASFSQIITESCKNIKGESLKYTVTPTSTIVEGSLDDLLHVAKKMHSAPLDMGVNRVITSIKLDQRNDKPTDMNDMINEVTNNI